MLRKSLSVIGCCLAAAHLNGSGTLATKIENKPRDVSLTQINGRLVDGWDDSYVSEQFIDKDNRVAKERERKEDLDLNSAENIEKNFA